MTISRTEFNSTLAPSLVGRGKLLDGPSLRFVWARDDRFLTVVAGPGEGRHCDLALACGLSVAAADDLALRLVLPEQQAGATLHRLAWLEPRAPVHVETYARVGADPERRRPPSRTAAIEAYGSTLTAAQREKGDYETAFRAATVPMHLRDRAPWVARLVERVAQREDVDPAHRRGERSWHCRGQKVLRLTRTKTPTPGVRVQAGIMTDELSCDFTIHGPIDDERLALALRHVEDGVRRRLDEQSKYHRPDEHWLQAVLRRNAHLVGLESRTLREVPAWRRLGAIGLGHRPSAWGLGYIDLVGVDHHGTVQLVETKLSANGDPMFILQGLDYGMYAEAYRKPITRRLDVHEKAPFAVTYALGAPKGSGLKLSRFAPEQLQAMPDELQPRVITLTNWWHPPKRPSEARVALASGQSLLDLVKVAKAPTGAASTGTSKRVWSRAEIDRAIAELEEGVERSIAQRLIGHADDHGAVLKGGTGVAPSAGFYYEVEGKRRSLWAIYVKQDGVEVRINLDVIDKISTQHEDATLRALRSSATLAARLDSSKEPPRKFGVLLREAAKTDPNIASSLLEAIGAAARN